MPAGETTDFAGNPNLASNVATVVLDTTGPTVTAMAATPEIETGENATFNVEFSEPVNGFTAEDLVVSGTDVEPTVMGAGTNYIVTFAAVPEAGTIDLSVAAGA